MDPDTLTRDNLLSQINTFINEYKEYNQEHIFDNLQNVSTDNLESLYNSISSFSLPFLMKNYQNFLRLENEPNDLQKGKNLDSLSPYKSGGLDLSILSDDDLYTSAFESIMTIPASERLAFLNTYIPTPQLPRHPPQSHPRVTAPVPDDCRYYIYLAMESLFRGESSSVLLAGGLGTRLQFHKPKGLYPCHTPSDQTLILRTLYSRYLILQLVRVYFEYTYGEKSDCKHSAINHHFPHGGSFSSKIPTSVQEVKIPLIILTSPPDSPSTSCPIQYYIKDLITRLTNKITNPVQNEPGLPPTPLWLSMELLNYIFFIQQGSFPALSKDGKLVLSNDRLVMSPNGNGGIYPALFPLLNGLKAGQIQPFEFEQFLPNPEHIVQPCVFDLKYLMFLNIDNLYNKVCDPLMLGYTIYMGVDVAVKTVQKTNPFERVGVLGEKNGINQIVEYSEIASAAEERDDLGVLKYNDGNTNIIIYKTEFLTSVKDKLCAAVEIHHTNGSIDNDLMNNAMQLHRADKNIPLLPNLQRYPLTEPHNSPPPSPDPDNMISIIKFELFAFDSFVYAKNITILRTNRNSHFLPMKSQNNPDSSIIQADTPRYCIDKASKVTVMALIQYGYNIFDINNKPIKLGKCDLSNEHPSLQKGLLNKVEPINGCDSIVHYHVPLNCLGYNMSMSNNQDEDNHNDESVCVCAAELGRGIEFNPTQFYGLSPIGLNNHANFAAFPTKTIIEDQSEFVNYPFFGLKNRSKLGDNAQNYDIHLLPDFGLIFHVDGTIVQATEPQSTI